MKTLGLPAQKMTIPFQSYLDSYSDMGDLVVVSPTVRQSIWSRVTAQGTMGNFGDVTVTLDPSQGPSLYRMTSQSPTGTPFFPADVETELYWRFEIPHNPLTGQPLVMRSNKVVYRASNVTSFPPPPGTAFTLGAAMTLNSPTDPGITCTVQPGHGKVVYSGQGVVPAVLINEVDVEDGGANRQFLELYDGGAGGTSLNDVSVVLFSGDAAQPYEVLRLTGRSTNPGGYFVIGDPGLPNVDLVKPARWHTGAGAVGLYVTPGGTFTPSPTPSTNQLMDAVVFGPASQPNSGLLALVRPGMPQADEAAAGNSTAHSLQRVPDGGWRRDTRHLQARTPTPGVPNPVETGATTPTIGIPLSPNPNESASPQPTSPPAEGPPAASGSTAPGAPPAR